MPDRFLELHSERQIKTRKITSEHKEILNTSLSHCRRCHYSSPGWSFCGKPPSLALTLRWVGTAGRPGTLSRPPGQSSTPWSRWRSRLCCRGHWSPRCSLWSFPSSREIWWEGHGFSNVLKMSKHCYWDLIIVTIIHIPVLNLTFCFPFIV